MNMFRENETEKVYFFKREFLNEKYSKLAAIYCGCSLEISNDKNGKLVWLWGNAEFEINDGSKTATISLDLDDKYELSIKKLDSIIDTFTEFKKEFGRMKVDYDNLEKEIKLNTAEETKNE